MKKSINLMTLKEIKTKFTIDQMLDIIVKFTKEAEKYKSAMRFAKSQTEYSMNECFYDIANSKVNKLESIAY